MFKTLKRFILQPFPTISCTNYSQAVIEPLRVKKEKSTRSNVSNQTIYIVFFAMK